MSKLIHFYLTLTWSLGALLYASFSLSSTQFGNAQFTAALARDSGTNRHDSDRTYGNHGSGRRGPQLHQLGRRY
jgi:hypothetical protein